MKPDRINLFIQILLGSALLLGIVLGVIDFYSLSGSGDEHSFWKTLHKVSLTDSIILVVVLFVANLLFFKFRNQTSQNSSHIDLLTGVVTRHAFGEMFNQAMKSAKESKRPLSVLMVDVDHFRTVNERHGHQIGDELLAMLSQAIASVLRPQDITCRWEGDCFLILLKDCSIEDSCKIAETMIKHIGAQTLDSNEKKIKITTSIGVAQMVSSDDTVSLVSRAETGLYSAQDGGRNTYAIGYDWILIDYSYDPILLPA
ncbi:MAG: GGDEF domain-containing protein [Desulfocapsa sp.]|nr:GGDEF domain-containing protein [Desulfocapsa sp.]